RARKQNYRLLRTLKRGGSQKLQLAGQESTGEREAISNRVVEVRTKVEEIVGIGFDGFVKSIFLPPAEFDRFLGGDASERRRIRSALFHLGISEERGKRALQIEQNTRIEQSTSEQVTDTTYEDVTEERKPSLETEVERLPSSQRQLSGELKII